jgi:hypothetical protein
VEKSLRLKCLPSSELRSETVCVALTTVFVEPEKLYKDVHIGAFIKFNHLRWLGHQQFMDVARNTKKIYQAKLHYKIPRR